MELQSEMLRIQIYDDASAGLDYQALHKYFYG